MNLAASMIVLALALPGQPAAPPAPAEKAPAAQPVVVLHTTKGDIKIELWSDKAPKTVANFLEYARSGHFDGTIFHRVIPGFVVQGGGLTADMRQKPTRAAIENEGKNGLKNTRGTLSMARTGDPHSATCQFFINLVDNKNLDQPDSPAAWGYAVFGKVIEGMDVVDAIAKVKTVSQGAMRDVPAEPIVVTKAEIKS